MTQQLPEEASIARTAKITVRGQGDTLNVLGDAQRVKLTGDDTQGRFTLIENENPPGTTLPVHLHRNEDEVFYVLEGRVEFDVAGERVVAEPGATVFLPQGVPHTWRVVGEEPARMLIMLMPAGLEAYFRELSALPADGPPDMEQVLEISGRYGIEFPEMHGGASGA
jgi:quercetin dioxygenase-like cupin family protein